MFGTLHRCNIIGVLFLFGWRETNLTGLGTPHIKLSTTGSIGSIRHYLDQKSAEKPIHSLVMCRIDSCNSLLYGLPDLHISKLQRIQNTAARLVTRSRTHDRITPTLQNLHWLPIRSRIRYWC